MVNLFGRKTRPISKGKAGKPVEFGYKTLVAANEQGLILHWEVHIAVPAVCRAQEKAGKVFAEVTADHVGCTVWRTKLFCVAQASGMSAYRNGLGKKDETRRQYERQATGMG